MAAGTDGPPRGLLRGLRVRVGQRPLCGAETPSVGQRMGLGPLQWGRDPLSGAEDPPEWGWDPLCGAETPLSGAENPPLWGRGPSIG